MNTQIQIHEIMSIQKFIQNRLQHLPLYQSTAISAKMLEINEHLIKNPYSTYFLKVTENSMTDHGINKNDILVVDRGLKPENGKIMVVSINGELVVRRLFFNNKRLYLIPANDLYRTIEVTDDTQLRIWGIAKWVIHPLKN